MHINNMLNIIEQKNKKKYAKEILSILFMTEENEKFSCWSLFMDVSHIYDHAFISLSKISTTNICLSYRRHRHQHISPLLLFSAEINVMIIIVDGNFKLTFCLSVLIIIHILFLKVSFTETIFFKHTHTYC